MRHQDGGMCVLLLQDLLQSCSRGGRRYVPAEAILGRVCKASCRKCKPEENHVSRRSGTKRTRTSEGEGQLIEGQLIARGRGAQAHQSSVRRTMQERPPAKNTDDMRNDDSSESEGSRDGEQEQPSRFQDSLGIRMCAADPRYITHE